jgi:hypothetical protein
MYKSEDGAPVEDIERKKDRRIKPEIERQRERDRWRKIGRERKPEKERERMKARERQTGIVGKERQKEIYLVLLESDTVVGRDVQV